MLPNEKKIVVAFIFSLYFGNVFAQTASYGELEAAYLYNFAKYTKCSGGKPISAINILGESKIINELQNFFKGKKIAGVAIELKIITSEEEVMQCQLVYLPSGASSKLVPLLKATIGKNVLIVTEDDLAKQGAPISFFTEDDKLKFRINKSALKQSGIEAAEGLLKLGVVM
jgi:hypothetical protein